MAADDPHRLAYQRVDDARNVSVLLDTLDSAAQWEATKGLRAWERARLDLAPGQRLLDVGCGPGDAALALAADLGDDGEVVGLDASAEMVAAVRSRAHPVACDVRFAVGDALALDQPDGSFDVVRSERTLQWLTDPLAAVTEMARVVRPGGLVSLLDTDWSTLAIHVGDDDLARVVADGLRTERARASNVGRRLGALAEEAGLVVVGRTAATHGWDTWDPDASPAPDGCFSMESLAHDLVEAGRLPAGDQRSFVDTIHAAAREGRFAMALTMFAVVATTPEPVRSTATPPRLRW